MRQRGLILGLVAVAALWGLTFPLVQDAVVEIPTLRFLAWRFAIATAALAFAFRRADRRTVRAGIALGTIWAAGYITQTLGLRTSTSTNVAFITGMYVVLTPLLAAIVSRHSPGRAALAGVALATAGLVLLASPSGLDVVSGDLLALACSALFAAHIVGIGIAAPDVDPFALTAVQAATVTTITLIATLVAEPTAWRMPSAANLGVLVLCGAGASALALVVQTRAQRVLPATPAAVILTLESVFGGIFGYLIAGDRLDAGGLAGAGLITVGVLIAAATPPRTAADLT